jgi:GNAT superfamily N-acetyltransferase
MTTIEEPARYWRSTWIPTTGASGGRALLQDALARLTRRGFEQASVWVLVGNERAERFYRIDGWAPDGNRRQDEISGVTVDEICYRRSLT